jgi:S-adenosylmethionine:tRNA ribosyltransferase-isomerase
MTAVMPERRGRDMTAVMAPSFELPSELIADGPIEAAGRRRDEARLLVAWRATGRLEDALFAELPRFLEPGDVLVVNTSATLPAAVPTVDGRLLHLSTELTPGRWVVEVRLPCRAGSRPFTGARPGEAVPLPGGGTAELVASFPERGRESSRLWVAALTLPAALPVYLARYGRPIRYGCPDTAWPTADYQTVFSHHPGSAEMPSAGRAFTPELVVDLVTKGVVFAPLTLHTGVSSLEVGEAPYAERFEVPRATAELVNAARANGHRAVAVGTTATRAIETVASRRGRVRPGAGWTDLVITPERGVRAIDGIITGWHEPEATHLQLLEAVARRDVLDRSYAHALASGYRWHEFGDLHLVLP